MTSAEGSSDFDSFESIDNDDVDVDIDIDNDNDGRKTSTDLRLDVVTGATAPVGSLFSPRPLVVSELANDFYSFLMTHTFRPTRPRPMANSSRHVQDSPHLQTKSYDQKKKNYLFTIHYFHCHSIAIMTFIDRAKNVAIQFAFSCIQSVRDAASLKSPLLCLLHFVALPCQPVSLLLSSSRSLNPPRARSVPTLRSARGLPLSVSSILLPCWPCCRGLSARTASSAISRSSLSGSLAPLRSVSSFGAPPSGSAALRLPSASLLMAAPPPVSASWPQFCSPSPLPFGSLSVSVSSATISIPSFALPRLSSVSRRPTRSSTAKLPSKSGSASATSATASDMHQIEYLSHQPNQYIHQ
jgi:hypothetical protein